MSDGDNNKSATNPAPRSALVEIPVLPDDMATLVKLRGPSGPCPTLRLPRCVPGGRYTVPTKLAARICVGNNPEFIPDDPESEAKIKAEQAKK